MTILGLFADARMRLLVSELQDPDEDVRDRARKDMQLLSLPRVLCIKRRDRAIADLAAALRRHDPNLPVQTLAKTIAALLGVKEYEKFLPPKDERALLQRHLLSIRLWTVGMRKRLSVTQLKRLLKARSF